MGALWLAWEMSILVAEARVVDAAAQVDASDRVVLAGEGIEQQGVWVQKAFVPFQVHVLPAVAVSVKAARHDLCEVADVDVKPSFVCKAAGVVGHRLSGGLVLDQPEIADAVGQDEIDPALLVEERAVVFKGSIAARALLALCGGRSNGLGLPVVTLSPLAVGSRGTGGRA